MNDDIKALADRLLMIEARLYAAEHRLFAPTAAAADPEPLPEWRRLVEAELAYECGVPRSAEQALARVLWLLTRLIEGDDTSQQLARIVAVCEAQVGDGWQADPRRGDLKTINVEFSVLYLLSGLTRSADDRWRVVGNRAAAWLRDLTEAGS